jgi:hypothetical protein
MYAIENSRAAMKCSPKTGPVEIWVQPGLRIRDLWRRLLRHSHATWPQALASKSPEGMLNEEKPM